MKKGRQIINFFRLALIAGGLSFFLYTSSVALATNYAGLVVKHGDGRVVTKCVEFAEESISGTELLRRSGLNVSIGGTLWGEAVYQIDGEGDPSGWVVRGGRTIYWAYYHLKEGSWLYSPVGAGGYRVRNGDVDGWVWTEQGKESSPPLIGFEEIYRLYYGSAGTPTAQGPQPNMADQGSQDQSSLAEAVRNTPGEGDQSPKKKKLPSQTQARAKKSTKDGSKSVAGGKDGFLNYLIFGFIVGGLTSLLGYYVFKSRKR